MSNFRTTISTKKYPFDINYSSKILFLGSCFSDHVSQKILDGGFSVVANPFGVLYNPISIKNAFNIFLEKKQFEESDLIFNQGLYHSFFHHGQFSNPSKEKALEQINKSISLHQQFVKNADFIFITFGTSYVYRHTEQNIIVSNCHKLPTKTFDHFSLTIEEIVLEYTPLLKALKVQNPNLQIIFTVSPIRHWKDGAHENQLSKARLHLAIEELQNRFDFVHYYPSYEIIMDDLRDYRFYAKDMIHLNTQAVNYIYEHFRNSFYKSETQIIEKRVIKLKQALNHRPFNPDTIEHRDFIKHTKQKIEQLLLEYPEINI